MTWLKSSYTQIVSCEPLEPGQIGNISSLSFYVICIPFSALYQFFSVVYGWMKRDDRWFDYLASDVNLVSCWFNTPDGDTFCLLLRMKELLDRVKHVMVDTWRLIAEAIRKAWGWRSANGGLLGPGGQLSL